MNGGIFFLGLRSRMPRSGLGWRIGTITSCFLVVPILALSGCTSDDSVPELVTAPAPAESQRPRQSLPLEDANGSPENEPAPLKDADEVLEDDPQRLEGSGETVWARGFEGQLIAGLDGEVYEPYHPVTVERVQRALLGRGLYDGPVNGLLDRPTMRAIYALQEAQYGMQRCGVPTPRTRKLLEQGSHTF